MSAKSSGASINAISPAFIPKNSLENKVVEHETKLALTMANTETIHVNKKTIKLDIVINGFKPYTAEFFILPVPDDRNVLLGMPWLHDQARTKMKDVPMQTTESYFSLEFGETKVISVKQFRCLFKKDKGIEYVFAVQSCPSNPVQRPTSIDNYKDHPVYPYLCKYPELFRQKLPAELPPAEHGEHQKDIKNEDPVFRQHWRQSPVQEVEITRWIREMKTAGLIPRSMSPHGARTFCVRKPDGWRIVHDYRAMDLNTIRRTMPMPRKTESSRRCKADISLRAQTCSSDITRSGCEKKIFLTLPFKHQTVCMSN
ncbi:hypothetical protein PHPALM_28091 [Phytophthora palmivora]|uniref:Pol protein n=1 Tax=Phytophthora palmivora TaxID=4796 RepID=A0A2P4XAX6_9STRA|nr:hypothetical protein PHPALM_28091 [Phytophthora palmivora]